MSIIIPGDLLNYDSQVFVNMIRTSNNPYQNNQNRWRIVIPQGTAPQYNTNVRYYKDDTITFLGNQYQANINYNQSVAPQGKAQHLTHKNGSYYEVIKVGTNDKETTVYTNDTFLK